MRVWLLPVHQPYRCVFRGGFVPNNGGIGENGAEPSRRAWPARPIFLLKGADPELRKSRDATHLATDGPAPRRYDGDTPRTVRCVPVFVRSEKSNALVGDGVLQPAPRSANLDSAFGGMQLFATEAWRAAPLLLTRSARHRVHSCERCQSGVSTPISFKENADSKSAVHTSQVSVSGAAE